MTVVKAAAVQISPVLYSREGTVQKVVQKILELGRLGVQFATFPETVVPYYPYFSFVQSPFEIRTGNEYLRLLDQAVTVPSATTNHRRGRQAGKDGGVDRRQRARRRHALQHAIVFRCRRNLDPATPQDHPDLS